MRSRVLSELTENSGQTRSSWSLSQEGHVSRPSSSTSNSNREPPVWQSYS
jgi:hypothetical protein